MITQFTHPPARLTSSIGVAPVRSWCQWIRTVNRYFHWSILIKYLLENSIALLEMIEVGSDRPSFRPPRLYVGDSRDSRRKTQRRLAGISPSPTFIIAHKRNDDDDIKWKHLVNDDRCSTAFSHLLHDFDLSDGHLASLLWYCLPRQQWCLFVTIK